MVMVPRHLILFLALLSVGCADLSGSSPMATSNDKTPLILVSLDGFRPDYLNRGQTPALSALATAGVLADGMRPSFPSVTFPNHYTLVTGLYPDHHGIVDNIMEDPDITPKSTFRLADREAVDDERWWDGATPLWVTADHQGMRTATLFWPGSDVAIQGARPDQWLRYDAAMEPEERVYKLLSWLDLPSDQRPSFLTLYFEHVDVAGHKFGPQSTGIEESLRHVDAAVERLVAGLRRRNMLDRVNLVIVADHGMGATSAERVVSLDDLVDVADVHVVSEGVVTGLRAEPGREESVERHLLGRHDHVTCWRKSDVPVALHYGSHPRVPAVVCLADAGWLMLSRRAIREGLAKGRSVPAGSHGYDPADPAMAALFIAHGPAFRDHYRQAMFDNVDVYPLLCRLLGLRAEPNDGRIEDVQGMLRQ